MKKKMAIIIAGIIVVLGVIFGISAMNGGKKGETIKKDTFTVGLEGTYAPFSYHDQNGKLTGYEVEMARDIAKEMGMKVNFVQAKWDSLIAGLNANRYDAVINNIGIRPDREKNYKMSQAYLYPRAALIKRSDDTSINNINDIKGKVMAQTLTSNYGQTAKDHGAEIKGISGIVDAMNLITTNRADGTLNDLGAFKAWQKSNPDAPVTSIDVSKEIQSTPAGVLMNKKSDKLQKDVNKALDKLKKDGTLKDLSLKYFDTDLSKK
ncbi:transporter substrate-binding domain-containing protein [Leuconostocaceae bacterium ESL0958]|nr:transporter substrate-binding domain-containing protein [Leuconostocaceae bacterium ESL0958]